MKIFKLFFGLVLLLCSVGGVYAGITDIPAFTSVGAWFRFDNNLSSSVGSAVLLPKGTLNESYNIDCLFQKCGKVDVASSEFFYLESTSQPNSVSLWYRNFTTGTYFFNFLSPINGTSNYFYVYQYNSTHYALSAQAGGSGAFVEYILYTPYYIAGDWNNLIFTAQSGFCAVYLNGVYIGGKSSSECNGGSSITDKSFFLNSDGNEQIDEIITWTNYTLNSSDVTQVYNMGYWFRHPFNLSYLINSKTLINGTLINSTIVNFTVTNTSYINLSNIYFSLRLNKSNETLYNGVMNNFDGSNITWTNPNTTHTGINFDGVDDRVFIVSQNLTNVTVSIWFFPLDINNDTSLGLYSTSNGQSRFNLYYNAVEKTVSVQYKNSTSSTISITGFINSIQTNKWNYVSVSWNGSVWNGYLNGVLQDSSVSSLTGVYFNPLSYYLAYDPWNSVPRYFNGSISDVRIYNRTLNATEILSLYQNSSNYNLLDGLVYQLGEIEPQYNRTLDRTFLLCSNCTNASLSVGLYPDIFKAYFYSETTDRLFNTSYGFASFYIDLVPPVVNNSLPSEINYYDGLNLSNYINCSDAVNLSSCIISFYPDARSINTSSLYNFTYNGNQTYNITALDSAGNTYTVNGTILINPYAYFRFNVSGGSLLDNYTFGGVYFNSTYSNFTLYGGILGGLGNKSLTFNKSGYYTQTFSFSVLNTSKINTTYNVTNASINIFIYDKNTFALIKQNISITLIGTTGLTTSTVTGMYNISNLLLLSESYSIITTSANFTTEVVYFTYTNQEILNISIYMTNTSYANEGSIYLQCNDIYSRGLKSATLQALQWDSTTSSFIKVSEKKADDTGKGSVNIILNDKIYRFQCIYGSESSYIGEFNVPTTEDGTTKYIVIGIDTLEKKYDLKNTQYSINETIINNVSTISFWWYDETGIDVIACLKVYYYDNLTNEMIYTGLSNCSTSTTGFLVISYNIFNLSKNYVITAEYSYYGTNYILQYFNYYANTSISKLLEDYFIIFKFILPFFCLGCVGIMYIGIRDENINNNRFEYLGVMLLILMFWIAPYLIPSIMGFKESLLITIISIGLIIAISGGDK